MGGIIVRYRYSGDEAAWQAVMDNFTSAVRADDAVRGRFRYVVTVAADGVARTHVGRWDSEEILKAVQSRDYFRQFTLAVQGFAGGQLESSRMTVAAAAD